MFTEYNGQVNLTVIPDRLERVRIRVGRGAAIFNGESQPEGWDIQTGENHPLVTSSPESAKAG
jgi:hypothetical protein